ncbi:hypothetical protein EJB05_48485, partial [Eragrostis curvula]
MVLVFPAVDHRRIVTPIPFINGLSGKGSVPSFKIQIQVQGNEERQIVELFPASLRSFVIR